MLPLFSYFPERTICRHEALNHRRDDFGWIGSGLSALPPDGFRVGDQVAVNGSRQLDREFDRLHTRIGGTGVREAPGRNDAVIRHMTAEGPLDSGSATLS